MVRSGDEPMHARSALRLRLALSAVGVVVAAAIGVAAWRAGVVAIAVAAALTASVALLNGVVVAARIRSGPHFQPDRSIPPYRPAEDRAPAAARPEVPEGVRQRRYLILMGVCLGLITLAWVWVRLVSVPAAVVMSLVAMVIPPIAAIVANAGWTGRR